MTARRVEPRSGLSWLAGGPYAAAGRGGGLSMRSVLSSRAGSLFVRAGAIARSSAKTGATILAMTTTLALTTLLTAAAVTAAEPSITPAPAFKASQLNALPTTGWITNGG